MARSPRYALTDHICRRCGDGRVLREIGGGPTGGGNPVYKCANCEYAGAFISIGRICWCWHVFQQPVTGLYFETLCAKGAINSELQGNGWRQMQENHGLSVLWRYKPDETTNAPMFELAETLMSKREWDIAEQLKGKS